MDEKLKNLTEQLYKEGIEKGNKEAEEHLKKAKDEAHQIVAQAKEKAEQIVAEAKEDAQELQRKSKSEMTLSSNQAITKLQNEIATMVSDSVVDQNLKNSFQDKDFLKKLINSTIEAWGKHHNDDFNMKLILSNMDSDIKSFVQSACQKQLDKGMEIVLEDKGHTGIKIGPKDNAYVLEFSEESFMNFFKDYLRPLSRKLLFNK